MAVRRKNKKSLGESGGERRDRKRRLRRDPREARAHILAAAKRVFSEVGPDAAGLKHVAREAGVSHGLVTHYFGRYDDLVEAVLEDAAQEAQQRVLAKLATLDEVGVEEVLEIFFEVIGQPQHGRVMAWALLSGRTESADFFARKLQGPRRVADAIEARLREVHPGAPVDRSEIDRLIMLVLAVGFGFSLGQGLLLEALGRDDAADERVAFRAWLADLVRSRMDRMLGQPP